MRRTLPLLMLVTLAAVPTVGAGDCTAIPLCSAPIAGTVLRGDLRTFDATATQGVPNLLEWYITDPGDAVPVTPAATGSSVDIVLDRSGRWSIGLRARYLHEAPGGVLYCDQTCVAVEVRSVDAVLADPGPEVDLADDLALDGTDSRWGASVAPVMTWRVDGVAWTGCGGAPAVPTAVTCSIPAESVGSHAVELELRDPANGDVDTDSVTVEVIDPPPQTADFSWSPTHPDPSQLVVFGLVTDPPLATTDMVAVTWSWGDGSPIEVNSCTGPFGQYCGQTSHVFTIERRFPVLMTVETIAGEVITAVHGIEVGSAQIFSDGFETGLAAGWAPGP